ncbi:MAG: phosphatase PAP2 family protein [Betaproteobacteria bacterium]|nr:phosphatase PAP2 family protein [Betaproteobacteria bacterium]
MQLSLASRLLQALCASALLSALAQPARASDTPYAELLVDDIKHVLTAPSRWEKPEWQNFGLAALAIAGTAAIVDRPLRDEMRRQSGNGRFMHDVERFGAGYSLGVLGGFYLAGAAGNNDRALAVAQDGLAASLIASGIVTPVLKYATGRSRPRETPDIAHFRPFRGAASFPSGHTTQAFAVASVISAHYDEIWVKCSSYTVAGLVGVARSYHDAHFASDVLAGALIGTLVGQTVVAYNQPRRSGKVALLPEVTPGWAGARLAGNF